MKFSAALALSVAISMVSARANATTDMSLANLQGKSLESNVTNSAKLPLESDKLSAAPESATSSKSKSEKLNPASDAGAPSAVNSTAVITRKPETDVSAPVAPGNGTTQESPMTPVRTNRKKIKNKKLQAEKPKKYKKAIASVSTRGKDDVQDPVDKEQKPKKYQKAIKFTRRPASEIKDDVQDPVDKELNPKKSKKDIKFVSTRRPASEIKDDVQDPKRNGTTKPKRRRRKGMNRRNKKHVRPKTQDAPSVEESDVPKITATQARSSLKTVEKGHDTFQAKTTESPLNATLNGTIPAVGAKKNTAINGNEKPKTT